MEISQFTGGFIGNVSWGSGTLLYDGRRYPFRLNGLGLGGMGGARVTASGEVFGLRSPADFGGVFAQFRGGAAVGGDVMRGWLWLRNTSGVRMRLRPNRSGLALQLGGDGLLVRMT
ncbi:hypothetical protein ACE7GA_12770 [Roseomonas sp. CCTCC AB2023176]|uniref:hypothetical protein n=1 Tax=Roseomonas sp. CCTCC AB2023176 TaxID=3342640 RepID=UPI0035DF4805